MSITTPLLTWPTELLRWAMVDEHHYAAADVADKVAKV